MSSLRSGPAIAETNPCQLELPPPHRDRSHSPRGAAKLHTAGNFLFCGDKKFFIKGASYGTFAPNSSGDLFPEPPIVQQDFSLMNAAGFNTVRTYDLPPLWLFDLAEQYGLRMLVGLPWPQHLTIGDSRAG